MLLFINLFIRQLTKFLVNSANESIDNWIIKFYTEKNSLYPCTRNQLFCLVRTGANFAILDEMTKFKFSKKNKESKLI